MSVSPFEGAQSSSYAMGWNLLRDMFPDDELETGNSLVELRRRSKQLIKDNGVVAGAQQAYVNLICNSGPVIFTENKKVNKLLDIWYNGCDITATLSFDQILEQIIQWSFVDGDILINLPMDSKRQGVQTVVELIEANRIQTPPSKMNKFRSRNNSLNNSDSPDIRHGVEYNSDGSIKGYWVQKSTLVGVTLSDADFTFYPLTKKDGEIERRVCWLFKAPLNDRPNMSRQYPVITPCITLFKYVKDYLDAVLIGARVSACFAGFVSTNNPKTAMLSMTRDADGNEQTDPNDSSRRVSRLQPGQISFLKPNETISFSSPNRPSDNHDQFMVRLYKVLAMYLRIPYSILFLDLNEVNYSSWRGGGLETTKMIKRWRRDLDSVIQWIYSTIIQEASLRGLTSILSPNEKIIVRWPVFGILDPEKDAKANSKRLETGVASKKMITDEQGIDYEDLLRETEAEALEATRVQGEVLRLQKEIEGQYGVSFNKTESNPESNPEKPEEENSETV